MSASALTYRCVAPWRSAPLMLRYSPNANAQQDLPPGKTALAARHRSHETPEGGLVDALRGQDGEAHLGHEAALARWLLMHSLLLLLLLLLLRGASPLLVLLSRWLLHVASIVGTGAAVRMR